MNMAASASSPASTAAPSKFQSQYRGSPTSLSISPKRASPSLRKSPCASEDDDDDLDLGIVSKRRKMTHDDNSDSDASDNDASLPLRQSLSPFSSPVGLFRGSPLSSFREKRASPVSLFRELREAELAGGGSGGVDRPASVSSSFCSSVGVDSSMNSSTQSSRMGSPSGERKYQKHELWAAIQSDYHYLMDEEIIETCKSTESDLSWESDDVSGSGGGGGGGGKFSLSEFVQQYNELTEWLNTIQAGTQRKAGPTLSEKYLNQSYYEELLRQSPRRRLLAEYSRRLVRRYPALRDEIASRMARVAALWTAVEATVALPAARRADATTVITDLEEDMGELRRWLYSVEERLPEPPLVDPAWDKQDVRRRLQEHKALQSEIESHSQLVTAVLKLCDRLEYPTSAADTPATTTPTTPTAGRDPDTPPPSPPVAANNPNNHRSLTFVARSLERRWHTVWLSSLEWQCRLEETLACTKTGRAADDGRWENEEEELTSTPVSTQTEPLSPYQTRRTAETTDQYTAADSDTSCNYDVLPFSESEYEKLTDDQTDDRYDDDDDDEEQELSYCHYPTADSALGRSVSDENNLGKAGVLALLRKAKEEAETTEIEVRRKEEEEGTSMRAGSAQTPMYGSLPTPPAPRTEAGRGNHGGDSHDVGYSSESHSNEEAEGGLFNNPLHASSPKLNTRIELKMDESVEAVASAKMRTKGLGEDVVLDDAAGQKSQWRQSMTSAYDTSSNCSDLAHAHELDLVPLDTSADTVCGAVDVMDRDDDDDGDDVTGERSDVSALLLTATPSQSFYCMTTIESLTDTEPSSAAEKVDGAAGNRSGATTDAEGDLSRSIDGAGIEELPFDENFSQQQHHVDTIPEEAVTSSSTGGSRSDVAAAGTDKERAMSMSISGGSNYDLEHATASDPERYSPRRTQHPNKNDLTELTSALNQFLAKQTKDTRLDNDPSVVLSEEDVQNGNSTKEAVQKSLKGLRSEACKPIAIPTQRTSLAANHSFTSTDGSVRQTDEGCDASSEGTGSESDSDFSTASSDNEHDPLDASVLTAIHKRTSTLCQDSSSRSLGASPLKATLRATKRKGDRPHSIADLYSMHAYGPASSISEGAIDHLRTHSLQEDNLKLRRTVSDLTSSPPPPRRHDSPRKHRRRRLRRTTSDESSKVPYSTGRRSSGRSSPVPIGTTSPAAHRHLPRPQPSHSTPTTAPTAAALSSPSYRAGLTSESDIELPRQSRHHLRHHNSSSSARRQLCLSPEYDCGGGAQTQQLNSTVDSFSEQTWDNYQVPPYSSVSEDPAEEKLDASHIVGEWEHNLDFEEDFHLDSRFGSGFRALQQGGVSSGGSGFLPPAPASLAEDSDSDLEDFNDVIEESCKALTFTEQALQKNRKDPLDMGIFLDPAEYSDALATCRTNIKCLEEVHTTLVSAATPQTPSSSSSSSSSSSCSNPVLPSSSSSSSAIPAARAVASCPATPTLLEEGLVRVDELIARWRLAQAVAAERRQQAGAAAGVWHAACQAKQVAAAAAETMEALRQTGCYHYVGQLEEALAELQHVKSVLLSEEQQLGETQELVDSLQLEHPSLNTATCEREMRALTFALRDLRVRTAATSSQLRDKLRAWYELDEIRRDLEYVLRQERREFACLELARALAQSQEEIAYSLHDIELLDIALGTYEASVERARALYAGDVAALCTPHAHAAVAADLACLHAQTAQLRAHTAHLVPVLRQAQTGGAGATQAAGSTPPRPDDALVNASVWQKLRTLLPLPVAMAIVFGAVYALDGDGIVFSPQLHYVRGPPPT